jgi:predicted DNA binding protein
VWVHGVTAPDPGDVFRTEAGIEDVEVIEESDGSVLYHLRWSPGDSGFLDAIAETSGALTSARATDDNWSCTIRFRDHSRVSEFKSLCDSNDVAVSLRSIGHGVEDSAPEGPLTPAQRETLKLAIEKGYFSIPRDTTLSGLADELGVSDQATSERIRRGIETLLTRRLETPEVAER